MMVNKYLSEEKMGEAREMVMGEGRELEGALWRYYFEGGGGEGVLAALGAYQNGDGGFGRGLEPDFGAVGSSVLATTVALQVLVAVGADESERLVVGGMGYLEEQYRREEGWWLVPAIGKEVPAAPWWHGYGEGVEAGMWAANPSLEVAG
ncbi:MAG TPA: hypothetical protein VLL52_22955, partial [Anaerolineae bacterium]|nr:hypothetical protein [Anaerolineae bacterium]